MIGVRYFYKRVRDDATIYQGSMFPLDDPELIEMTEEDYFSELQPAEPTEGDETDEATEADLMDALAELGVIS